MMLLRILVGIGLLVMGRRVFLLFVGLIGFITGIHLAYTSSLDSLNG